MKDKAKNFAQQAHGDTLDDSGNNYFIAHVLQVALLVEMVTNDEDVIAAAYLHDVVEDCGVTHELLVREFNKRVADLVLEVTHDGEKDSYGYYFPRLETRDGILIKFADRLSNLSRMEAWDEKRQQQYLHKSKFWKDGKSLQEEE